MHVAHNLGKNPCIMRMGNFMCPGNILKNVMAATESRMGIRHVTVVPTNFEPPVDLDSLEDDEE